MAADCSLSFSDHKTIERVIHAVDLSECAGREGGECRSDIDGSRAALFIRNYHSMLKI